VDRVLATALMVTGRLSRRRVAPRAARVATPGRLQDLFFPTLGETAEAVREACGRCEVAVECRDYAVEAEGHLSNRTPNNAD
jgi:hypothetical protein